MRETRAQTLPSWYSPEIIKGQAYSQEVDVWALGITAYQLACGKLPFLNVPSPDNILSTTENRDQQTLTNKLVSISTKGVPKLPNTLRSANFRDFIYKCTEVKPENRWNTSMLIYHPFLQAAEDMQAQWIQEFQQHLGRGVTLQSMEAPLRE